MKEYGADADWTDMDTITVKPQPYKETSYMIENDWSASSYWYEIMALNGNIDSRIKLEGLMDCSKQGDSVVKYIFSLLGVKSEFESHDHLSNVMLKANRCLLPKFDYDFSGSPDLAQTIVVACCALGVKFKFTGLASLKIKETDRIEALKIELKKVGYVMKTTTLCIGMAKPAILHLLQSIPTRIIAWRWHSPLSPSSSLRLRSIIRR